MIRNSRVVKAMKEAMTVVGALIVFVTFLVNESKLETYRDLADSIDRAHGESLIRKDIRKIDFGVDSANYALKFVLDELGQRTRRNAKELAEVEADEESLILAMRHYDVIYTTHSLRESAALLEKLPANSKLADRLNQLKEHLGASSEDFERLIGKSYPAATDELSSDVFKFAEEQDKYYADKRDQWKRWSIVLYTVGWGLSLSGKFIGVEVDGPEV